jgi:hypothetical protein
VESVWRRFDCFDFCTDVCFATCIDIDVIACCGEITIGTKISAIGCGILRLAVSDKQHSCGRSVCLGNVTC